MSTDFEQLRQKLVSALEEAQHGFGAAALSGPSMLAIFAIGQDSAQLRECARQIPDSYPLNYRASFIIPMVEAKALARRVEQWLSSPTGELTSETLQEWRDLAKELRDALARFENPEDHESPGDQACVVERLQSWASENLSKMQQKLLNTLIEAGSDGLLQDEIANRIGSKDPKGCRTRINRKLIDSGMPFQIGQVKNRWQIHHLK